MRFWPPRGKSEYNYLRHIQRPRSRGTKINIMASKDSLNGDRRSVVATAPCRADLAGSTLDLWPLYLFHPGAITLNFAVNIMASCKITVDPGEGIRLVSRDTGREDRFTSLDQLCRARQYRHPLAARLARFFRPECGFTLETHCESPVGAGLAGSSALMIALTGALSRLVGRDMPIEQMRITAQNVEAQMMHVPT